MALESNAERRLGEVLAEAVKVRGAGGGGHCCQARVPASMRAGVGSGMAFGVARGRARALQHDATTAAPSSPLPHSQAQRTRGGGAKLAPWEEAGRMLEDGAPGEGDLRALVGDKARERAQPKVRFGAARGCVCVRACLAARACGIHVLRAG